jgi:hypothetical protein
MGENFDVIVEQTPKFNALYFYSGGVVVYMQTCSAIGTK